MKKFILISFILLMILIPMNRCYCFNFFPEPSQREIDECSKNERCEIEKRLPKGSKIIYFDYKSEYDGSWVIFEFHHKKFMYHYNFGRGWESECITELSKEGDKN